MLNISVFIPLSDSRKAVTLGHWGECNMLQTRRMLSSKINQMTLLTIPKFLAWTRLNWVFLSPDTLFFLDPFIRSFPSWKNQSPGDSELIWDTPPHPYLSDQDQACSPLISSTDPSKASGFTSAKMCVAVWFGKQREACVATCAFKTPQSWCVVLHQSSWRNLWKNGLVLFSRRGNASLSSGTSSCLCLGFRESAT